MLDHRHRAQPVSAWVTCSRSEPDQRGVRTVICTINGQLRPIPPQW